MFDINAVINTAIATAVQEAIKPLVNQIGCLEADLEQLVFVVEQRTASIAALEARIATLENNPAQGQDPWVEQRITALEGSKVMTADAFVNHLDQQEWFWEKVSRFATTAQQRELDDEIMGIKQRVTALEDADEKTLDSDDVEAMIERALDDHCSTYDHDDYDRAVSAIDEVDLEDMVTTDNLPDLINDALSGATVSIRV